MVRFKQWHQVQADNSACVCVLSSYLFWTSGLWTYQAGSHRISHPPSFCGACLNFSREKDSAVSFPRRPSSRILCTNDFRCAKLLYSIVTQFPREPWRLSTSLHCRVNPFLSKLTAQNKGTDYTRNDLEYMFSSVHPPTHPRREGIRMIHPLPTSTSHECQPASVGRRREGFHALLRPPGGENSRNFLDLAGVNVVPVEERSVTRDDSLPTPRGFQS